MSQPTILQRSPSVASPSASLVRRDAQRAARCCRWAERGIDGVEQAPRPLYRPSTSALRAFRPHPTLPPPSGAPYDFLRDAAHPLSLADVPANEMWALYDVAAAGQLRGLSLDTLPWDVRLRTIALWEPYRRVEGQLLQGSHAALFAPILWTVRWELRCADESTAIDPSLAERWQARRRALEVLLHELEANRQPGRRPADPWAHGCACVMGAACTTMVCMAVDQARGQVRAPDAYASMAVVFALLSALLVMAWPCPASPLPRG